MFTATIGGGNSDGAKTGYPVGEEISFEASNNNQQGCTCGVEP
jgi:hypothetical protein